MAERNEIKDEIWRPEAVTEELRTLVEDVNGHGASKEEKIFAQNVSEAEREGVAMEQGIPDGTFRTSACLEVQVHSIYEGGFPSCVTSVEEDSWCRSADACYRDAIEYAGMKECSKAWK